jgi:hypothetical protein
MCEVFVAHVDFDRAALSRGDEAAIAQAEENRHKALNVVGLQQVVRSPDSNIEMFKHWKSE